MQQFPLFAQLPWGLAAPPLEAVIGCVGQFWPDGINRSRVVEVAVYCRLNPECKGDVTLSMDGRQVSVGQRGFSVPGGTTSHVPIRLAARLMRLIREHGVATTLTAVVGARTFTQTVEVKIF